MAIVKRIITTAPENAKISLDVDNGDLEALQSVIVKYHFIDEQAAIRFALIVLLNSENNNVYVDKNGQVVKITPNSSLIDNDGTVS